MAEAKQVSKEENAAELLAEIRVMEKQVGAAKLIWDQRKDAAALAKKQYEDMVYDLLKKIKAPDEPLLENGNSKKPKPKK